MLAVEPFGFMPLLRTVLIHSFPGKTIATLTPKMDLSEAK